MNDVVAFTHSVDRGRTATVWFNGAAVLTQTYATSTTTGLVGLLAKDGVAQFDDVLIRGNFDVAIRV